jgi:hypothetical protein
MSQQTKGRSIGGGGALEGAAWPAWQGRLTRLTGRAARLARGRELLMALALYGVLSVALSWPTALHFTTAITTSGVDALHNLWLFWHVREALLGRAGLFDAALLYYPRGISLLVHGVGPLTGLFALPFWPLGAEAAYNGALLVALALSGLCGFGLARRLGLERGVSLFAGVMVIAAPMTLAGLNNHVTKVFVGGPALAFLALSLALEPGRSRRWALATGAALLLTLLHNGYQFVYTALGLAALALLTLHGAPPEQRRAVLGRAALAGVSALLLAGPLLLAILGASGNPEIGVDVNQESRSAPDLAQYLLPWHESALFGGPVRTLAAASGEERAILLNSEMAVSLAAAGLALCLAAWWLGDGRARRWCLLALGYVVVSMGPQLRVLTRTEFTEYELPVLLPYALLTELPGLEFMRAPGRAMMVGFTVFAIAAAFGLAALTRRFPRRRRALVAGATLLVLLQNWPRPFPSAPLPETPAFYRAIAADGERYGVFDLPVKSSPSLGYNWKAAWTSSNYQIFQMTHGKGIAGGYISRTYTEHPVFADVLSDEHDFLLLEGRPAYAASFPTELARNGYRYVVLHKTLFASGEANPGVEASRALLAAAFGNRAPAVDDAEVLVYEVTPDMARLSLRWGEGWRGPEEGFRWARSPATVSAYTPVRCAAELVVTPALLHGPGLPGGLGATGELLVTDGTGRRQVVPLEVDRPAVVPLVLTPGDQPITLELAAGNFRPSDYGHQDSEELSFAVRAVELRGAAGDAEGMADCRL